MSKDTKSASDRHLEAAARNLAQSSPGVSAHLMLRKDSQKIHKSAFQNGVCGSCGTIQVPGKTSEARVERQEPAQMRKKGRISIATKSAKLDCKIAPKQEKWLRMECKACHAFERTMIDSPRIQSTNNMKATSEQLKSSKISEGGDSSLAQSINQSSKARAKARRGGLQAMITRPKGPTTSGAGLGLDLMDLMKEGNS